MSCLVPLGQKLTVIGQIWRRESPGDTVYVMPFKSAFVHEGHRRYCNNGLVVW